MLWIREGGRSEIVAEVERLAGVPVTVTDARTSDWKKNLHRYRVLMVELPVEPAILEEAFNMLQEHRGRPALLIHDANRLLDESLVRPSVSGFWYVTGEDSAELARNIRAALAFSGQTRSDEATEEILQKWLIGESRPMRELRALVRLVAPRNSTVLISGETGTGKERVANAIHAISQRANSAMVAVNCGALPETLIEAELFGHTKGAFTGAIAQRVGLLEQAHKTTLFLDEIAEIPIALQSRLLRTLQERELQRVGSSETIKLDCRIIAATNANLLDAIAQKRFRQDLYYRLNVVPIHLPPLRDRRSDIPLLAEYFAEQVCLREDIPRRVISDEAMRSLTNYSWPGNVRQLEHVIEAAISLSGRRCHVFAGDINLPQPVSSGAGGLDDAVDEVSHFGIGFENIMGRIEKMLLDRALESCGGNKAKAANLLGIKRTTLLYKMKALENQGSAA